jgi:ABC-type Mn2+/Zn2+ transport system ATPase subunit
MMNEVVFALALNVDNKFVVVDGPFATRYEALDQKNENVLLSVLKLSKESFNKAIQWSN